MERIVIRGGGETAGHAYIIIHTHVYIYNIIIVESARERMKGRQGEALYNLQF